MRNTAILFLVLASFTLGCRTAAGPVEPSPGVSPKPETPPGVSREGQVDFEVVGELKPSVPVLEADQEYSAAFPMGPNELPVYPEELLRHNLGRQEIVVRVIIDTQGRVARLEESPVPSNGDPAYRADFVRAVETAVRSWQFAPANIRAFGPGPDDDGDGKGDYILLKSETALTSYHDLRFFFEIKEGRGVVTSG